MKKYWFMGVAIAGVATTLLINMFGVKDAIMSKWARTDSITVRIGGKLDLIEQRQKDQNVLQSKIRDEDLEARDRFHERFNTMESRMNDLSFIASRGDSTFMTLLEGRLIGIQQDFQMFQQAYNNGQKVDSTRFLEFEHDMEQLRFLMTAPPETVLKYIEKVDKDRWWNPKDWID